MAIRLLVTRGYGNGTFNGTVGEVVLRGYSSLLSVTGTGAIVAGQSVIAGAGSRTIIGSGNIVIETTVSGSSNKIISGTGEILSDQSVIHGRATTVVNSSGSIVSGNCTISNVEEEIDLPKIILDPISGSYGATEKINSNFELIEEALNNQIMYRDNPVRSATSMLTGMDMNLNRIYNLPDAVDAQDPATFGQLKSLLDTTGTVTVSTESQLGGQIVGGVTTLLLVLYEVGVDSLSIYVEGKKQRIGRDYLETSPITITWLNVPAGTDNIDFYNRNLAV